MENGGKKMEDGETKEKDKGHLGENNVGESLIIFNKDVTNCNT